MAVHTGFSHGPFHIFCRMKRSLALFALSMAGDTVDIRRKHQTGRVRNTNPSTSAIKLSWSQMDLLAVALITNSWRMGKGRESVRSHAEWKYGNLRIRSYDR